MRWAVRIFPERDRQRRPWFDVVAVNLAPVPYEHPYHFVARLPSRERAMAVARDFCEHHGCRLHEAEVIPFPKQGRAA